MSLITDIEKRIAEAEKRAVKGYYTSESPQQRELVRIISEKHLADLVAMRDFIESERQEAEAEIEKLTDDNDASDGGILVDQIKSILRSHFGVESLEPSSRLNAHFGKEEP